MRTAGVRLLVLGLVSLAAVPAVAQPPDILRSYQFVPRRSALEVQGGFAGLSLKLPIFGKFDFITGYRPEFPALNPYAEFANMDAIAFDPLGIIPRLFGTIVAQWSR
jgi:hypothetical protein